MQVIDDETRRFGRLLHYAGVLAAVLCGAFAYSLLHVPLMKTISERAAQIQELKLSLENTAVVREQHRKVSQRLRELQARIAEIERRVPGEANAGEFLKDVTEVAAAERLAITNFSPEKAAIKDGYTEMEVKLKGAGSFASICTFVDRLSRLNRLSKVKNLTLSATDDQGGYPMTATLVIYYGLESKSAKAGQEGRRG